MNKPMQLHILTVILQSTLNNVPTKIWGGVCSASPNILLCTSVHVGVDRSVDVVELLVPLQKRASVD
jgi:hypothetical protein